MTVPCFPQIIVHISHIKIWPNMKVSIHSSTEIEKMSKLLKKLVAFDMGETTVDDKKLGFCSPPIASSYWIF
jgi:hypothetical protein